MLRLLGIAKTVIFTNNPAKIAALHDAGIEVERRMALTGEVTVENAADARIEVGRTSPFGLVLRSIGGSFGVERTGRDG